MDDRDALLRARALLLEVTPLHTDCGLCCGHACCQPDETGRGGMLLFPVEETLYEGKEDFLIEPSLELPGYHLLICKGFCKREDRPLSCMLFPLLPKEKGDSVRAVRDRRGFIVCPLLPSGLSAFSPEFRQAVKEAGEILYQSRAHREFLTRLHALIDSFENML